MSKGKLTISIDLELAWGVWDILTADDLRMAASEERPICAALLDLFDRHDVPATWAMVAALLDKASSTSKPGGEACWYAPDIVDQIVAAKAKHEIGSHGGRHIYFDAISADDARADLNLARQVHRDHDLPFRSMVFPRNGVGHLDALAQAGICTFRGPDVGWFRMAERAGRMVARAANLADKALPIPPRPVRPEIRNGLIDLPGSMLLLGRNGARRFVLPEITRAKLSMGLHRARRNGETFHLWFHPSNFYFRRQEQFDTLGWFLERAAEEAGRGQIEIVTMGGYAGSPPLVPRGSEAVRGASAAVH